MKKKNKKCLEEGVAKKKNNSPRTAKPLWFFGSYNTCVTKLHFFVASVRTEGGLITTSPFLFIHW